MGRAGKAMMKTFEKHQGDIQKVLAEKKAEKKAEKAAAEAQAASAAATGSAAEAESAE